MPAPKKTATRPTKEIATAAIDSKAAHSKKNAVSTTPSNAPLYQQVVAVLRDEIVKGVFPVGSLLPTENELCERFVISRYTVREALRELRISGLVTSRRGSGTTVTMPKRVAPAYLHQIGSIADLSQYAVASWKVLTQSYVLVDVALSETLESEVGQKWLRVEALRFMEETAAPVSWTQLYLHADYGRVARLIGTTNRPIHEMIFELYGELVDEVLQTMTCRPINARVGKLLGVKGGETVVEVQRLFRLASGTVVYWSSNFYPADQFKFSMVLRRSV